MPKTYEETQDEIRTLFKGLARVMGDLVKEDTDISRRAFDDLESSSLWFHEAVSRDYRNGLYD